MHDLDTLDRTLIGLLRADGRAPVSRLAEALGVSRGTVQNRLDRLVDEGMIVGFTVRLREDLDDDVVRAMMVIRLVGQSTTAVVRQLRGMPVVRAVHTTNGAWDLMAEIAVVSLPDLDRVLSAIRSIHGIENSETSILLTSV
ncbi:MAG: Lrp/AsnC family transcriptional regulator [Acidimicrobiales bacterium]